MDILDLTVVARRSASGVPDFDYYAAHARRLRALALRLAWRQFRRALRHSWAELQQYRARREAQRALAAMSRRELGDIGLTPADVHAIQSGAYFGDATRRARDWPQAAANDGDWTRRPAPGVRA